VAKEKKEAGKMKLENAIYSGDNLTWLKKQSSLFTSVIKSKALECNINFNA